MVCYHMRSTVVVVEGGAVSRAWDGYGRRGMKWKTRKGKSRAEQSGWSDAVLENKTWAEERGWRYWILVGTW